MGYPSWSQEKLYLNKSVRLKKRLAIFLRSIKPKQLYQYSKLSLTFKRLGNYYILTFESCLTVTAKLPYSEIDGETVETVSDFIFLGSKITADGDCSHEIKRHSLEEKL